MRGKFVTLEGVEGVGKSTNLACIGAVLDAHGIPHVSTREPGGTPLSEKIRVMLLDRDETSMTPTAELLLMFAARAQHVEELIRPALARGEWVICDRFTDSTWAYQGGGRGLPDELISMLEMHALGGFKPDLTVLLDLPVEIGMQRALARSEHDRFEREDRAFFEKVRETFLARARDDTRFAIVDASRDIEQVNADVTAIIEAAIAECD